MKLPKIKKGFGSKQTVRQYLQEKQDANKIPKALDSYLCEREIYTTENYAKVHKKYSGYIQEHTDKVNACCITHNDNAFYEIFDQLLETTNDWITARMVIHGCIKEFSVMGVAVFEWADDRMIDRLYQSDINR